ncbi:hypothetical protein E2562_006892 [Oryza meyeriana var. granulata]|uniref:Uncharacterized protein n=1 Tax=Oryza meyeriana var. granulata TaxID=110450 RepID=A0A6G1BJ60_9ORYZ|nr:hypothetical protein E2562_006892 [Oryza meyeriana var. granulata]
MAATLAMARRKWMRDDAVCCNGILVTLSDHIFPNYILHSITRAAFVRPTWRLTETPFGSLTSR